LSFKTTIVDAFVILDGTRKKSVYIIILYRYDDRIDRPGYSLI